MYIVALGKLRQRALALDRFKGHFCFESR